MIGQTKATTVTRIGSCLLGLALIAMTPSWVNAEISDEAKRSFNKGVELEQAKKVDSAIAAYNAAIAAAPEYLDAHINVGALYYEKGELTDAAKHLGEAIRLDSAQAGAYKTLGLVRKKAKEHPAAIAAFDKYLAMKPDDGAAWASLASTHSDAGDDKNAITAYNKALAADPKDHRAAYNLGNLLQKAQRYDDAIAAYKKAIAAKSNYVGAYYNLAICSQQADWESCVPDYEAFIKAAGTSKKWAAKVTEVKGIVKQITDYLDTVGE